MPPVIPQYIDQGRVQTEALPGVRVQTDAPAEAFGGGQSAQNLAAATNSSLGIVGKIAEEQQNQADQAAHLQADTALTELQTKIQSKVAQMHGEDAITAPDYAKQEWDKGYQDIFSGMQNSAQKQATARSGMILSNQLNKSTLLHSSTEANNYKNVLAQSSVQTAQNAAVLNAGDSDIVAANADKIYAVSQDQAKWLGIPQDSPVFEHMVVQNLSPMHSQVIQARLDAGLDQGAKDYFEKNKDEMSSQDILRTQSAIENQAVVGEGNKIFSDLQNQKGLKLSDGTYDLGKIKNNIDVEGMSDKKAEALVNYVQHQASEFNANKNREDQSRFRSVMNQAYQFKQDGVPLAQAISLATKYGQDQSEQANLADTIGKIYAPPSQSDPQTYVNLWEPAYSGQGNQQSLDQAKNNGLINASDWRALTELNYKNKVDGVDPQTKNANERIKIMANEQFGSDADSKAKFLYDVHLHSDGKSPQELEKFATDQLAKDPSTGVWGWFQDKKFQTDFTKSDAHNLATGKVYEDVGQNTAIAIGQGMSKQTGKPWGLSDINNFAQSFGGYSKIAVGTPVNNAVNSLIENGKPATAANVKALLQKYPDGNWK